MNAIQNLNSTNNVNGSLAIEVYLKNFRKGFLLNLSPIPKHVSYAITYTGTPLIQSPMGQIKFALLTGWPYQRGFFFSLQENVWRFLTGGQKQVAVITRWP